MTTFYRFKPEYEYHLWEFAKKEECKLILQLINTQLPFTHEEGVIVDNFLSNATSEVTPLQSAYRQSVIECTNDVVVAKHQTGNHVVPLLKDRMYNFDMTGYTYGTIDDYMKYIGE